MFASHSASEADGEMGRLCRLYSWKGSCSTCQEVIGRGMSIILGPRQAQRPRLCET